MISRGSAGGARAAVLPLERQTASQETEVYDKEKRMKLLLNTIMREDFDGCNYAYVDLTTELAGEILRRRAMFNQAHAQDSSLMCMEFYAGECLFLYGLPEELDDTLAYGENWAEIEADGKELEALAERTECDRVVITDDCVYWTCYPKHCDFMVETCWIAYQDVERAAGAAQAAA